MPRRIHLAEHALLVRLDGLEAVAVREGVRVAQNGPAVGHARNVDLAVREPYDRRFPSPLRQQGAHVLRLTVVVEVERGSSIGFGVVARPSVTPSPILIPIGVTVQLRGGDRSALRAASLLRHGGGQERLSARPLPIHPRGPLHVREPFDPEYQSAARFSREASRAWNLPLLRMLGALVGRGPDPKTSRSRTPGPGPFGSIVPRSRETVRGRCSGCTEVAS